MDWNAGVADGRWHYFLAGVVAGVMAMVALGTVVVLAMEGPAVRREAPSDEPRAGRARHDRTRSC